MYTHKHKYSHFTEFQSYCHYPMPMKHYRNQVSMQFSVPFSCDSSLLRCYNDPNRTPPAHSVARPFFANVHLLSCLVSRYITGPFEINGSHRCFENFLSEGLFAATPAASPCSVKVDNRALGNATLQ